MPKLFSRRGPFSTSRQWDILKALEGRSPDDSVAALGGAALSVGKLRNLSKVGIAGKYAVRGAGALGLALTAKDLAELLYDASYGWEKQGKVNRASAAYGRMADDEEAFGLADQGHESDVLAGAANASRSLETGVQNVAISEQSKLMEALAPMKAQLAVNAYREQPSLSEMLARMGYGE